MVSCVRNDVFANLYEPFAEKLAVAHMRCFFRLKTQKSKIPDPCYDVVNSKSLYFTPCILDPCLYRASTRENVSILPYMMNLLLSVEI